MPVQTYYDVISGDGSRAIAASVEAGIASGALPAGERLPTVRELAARLRVSPATVAEAYRQLRERGLLTGAGRGGTRVRSARPRSWRRSAPPAATGVRNLAGGNPDPALLPDLRPALAAVAGQLGDGKAVLYGQAESRPDLVSVFAQAFAADGMDATDLVIVGGALDGIARVLDVHLRPGDKVAVEDPCYCGILDVLEAGGLQPVPVAVDDRGLRPEQLEPALRQAQALILTPRNHSPTGAALDATRAAELRAVIDQAPELLVIEDDPAALIADAPMHTIAGRGDRQRWAVVRSVAKALGPDLRLAALAADPTTARRVLTAQQATTGWVSHLLQAVVLAVLQDPVTPDLLAHASATYARRRQALLDALADRAIPAHGRSGLNVWLPVDDEATTAQTLQANGWTVRGGEAFRLVTPPGLRITVATLQPDDAIALADRIVDALTGPTRSRAA
jgi:DNA-binding transcriptional MocR family regulator